MALDVMKWVLELSKILFSNFITPYWYHILRVKDFQIDSLFDFPPIYRAPCNCKGISWCWGGTTAMVVALYNGPINLRSDLHVESWSLVYCRVLIVGDLPPRRPLDDLHDREFSLRRNVHQIHAQRCVEWLYLFRFLFDNTNKHEKGQDASWNR